MFDGLIGGTLARVIADAMGKAGGELIEIRLRAGRRLLLYTASGERIYPEAGGGNYIVSQAEIDDIISRATNMSPYSVSDELLKGYIPHRSLRIGVAGEGALEGGRLIGIKNISYLALRVPHQILTAADEVIDEIYSKSAKSALNTLIIAPPAGGKTTVLREIARIISHMQNVVVIDERYELACAFDGESRLDVGDADVVSGVPKSAAYGGLVRAMNPDVIITDELFGEGDVNAVCDIVRSGVKVIASVHADSLAALGKFKEYARLLDAFDVAVVLGKNPVGSVREIVRL